MTHLNLAPSGSKVYRVHEEASRSTFFTFWVSSSLRITIKPLPPYLSTLPCSPGLDRHRKISGWHYSTTGTTR